MKQAALVVYVFAALTDWYDGWVARRWGYVTRWGKFFDPLADKILTSTAFVTFVLVGYADAWLVWIIVVREYRNNPSPILGGIPTSVHRHQ